MGPVPEGAVIERQRGGTNFTTEQSAPCECENGGYALSAHTQSVSRARVRTGARWHPPASTRSTALIPRVYVLCAARLRLAASASRVSGASTRADTFAPFPHVLNALVTPALARGVQAPPATSARVHEERVLLWHGVAVSGAVQWCVA